MNIKKSPALERAASPFFFNLIPGLLYQGISFILIGYRKELED